jgi:hypothetical protein
MAANRGKQFSETPFLLGLKLGMALARGEKITTERIRNHYAKGAHSATARRIMNEVLNTVPGIKLEFAMNGTGEIKAFDEEEYLRKAYQGAYRILYLPSCQR